ncbi:MAG TPA: SH3 domain-containing protein [Clostridiales bacterium]|nr:SH3 domain-containing protein [Clostridiales bacterium]
MKKGIYLSLLLMIVILLTGCGKEEEMTSFIPTQPPTKEADVTATAAADAADTDQQEDPQTSPTPKVIRIGQTTPKYVKMDKYGATLNVRSIPSTSGEVVGFLVHAEKIRVAEIVDGWASFLYNGTLCYVNADYLVDEQPEYLEPPTPTPTPVPKAEASGQGATKPEI